jgi:uncharacterized protein with PIN domain
MDKFVYIRLFAGLNFFVPNRLKQKTIQLRLFGNPSVKDVVESVGVMHTEFEFITVNGEIVNFSYRLNSSDHINVYPHFFQIDVSGSIVQENAKPIQHKFIIDVHLGKLSTLLRMLGFDCYYRNDLDDNEIIEIARMEDRIVLSRDIGIFKNAKVKWGYFPRSQDPKIQLKEILDRYDLRSKIKPLCRCINCNGALEVVDKGQILNDLKENTKLYYHDFYCCKECKKTYWKGSHYYKMLDFIEGFSHN